MGHGVTVTGLWDSRPKKKKKNLPKLQHLACNSMLVWSL